jgi:hypothetical protein
MTRTLLLLIAVPATVSLLAPRVARGQERTSNVVRSPRAADLSCSVKARQIYERNIPLGPIPALAPLGPEITDGTTIEGPANILVKVSVANSGGAPARNVPLSVKITANGQPVQQAKLGPYDIADWQLYTFYGTYPIPVTVSIPEVLRSESVARSFGPSFPKSLHTLGPEKTYALSLKATIDPSNTIRESSKTNNECSMSLNVHYPSVLIPSGR